MDKYRGEAWTTRLQVGGPLRNLHSSVNRKVAEGTQDASMTRRSSRSSSQACLFPKQSAWKAEPTHSADMHGLCMCELLMAAISRDSFAKYFTLSLTCCQSGGYAELYLVHSRPLHSLWGMSVCGPTPFVIVAGSLKYAES